jgi:hypothetical protein
MQDGCRNAAREVHPNHREDGDVHPECVAGRCVAVAGKHVQLMVCQIRPSKVLRPGNFRCGDDTVGIDAEGVGAAALLGNAIGVGGELPKDAAGNIAQHSVGLVEAFRTQGTGARPDWPSAGVLCQSLR